MFMTFRQKIQRNEILKTTSRQLLKKIRELKEATSYNNLSQDIL